TPLVRSLVVVNLPLAVEACLPLVLLLVASSFLFRETRRRAESPKTLGAFRFEPAALVALFRVHHVVSRARCLCAAQCPEKGPLGFPARRTRALARGAHILACRGVGTLD